MSKWGWTVLMMIWILFLSACNAEETTAGDPTADTFPAVTQVIENGVTPMATSDASGPGGEIITGEQIPPVEMPEGQAMDAPALLTSLFVLDIAGQTGKAADMEGAIFDVVNGQMLYLVASSHGPTPEREMLIPWGAFYIVSFPGDIEAGGMHPAPTIWLKVDEALLADAPDFDRAVAGPEGELSGDWDAPDRAYWAADVPSLPVTGREADGSVPALLVQGGITGRFNFPAQDRDGRSLGAVEDILLDQQARALFVMLRPSNLRNGDGWIAAPWRAFVWSPEEQAFILQVAPEALENAPRLDPNELPDTTLSGWDTDLQQYWQEHGPGGQAAQLPTSLAAQSAILFSVLQERMITTRAGQSLGQPADWFFDADGQSRFAVIESDSGFTPLPWRLLDWQAEDHVEMVQDRPVIDGAPAYTSLEDLDRARNWVEIVAGYWENYAEVDKGTDTRNLSMVRTGLLLNRTVFEAQGKALGRAVDMVIEPADKPLYVLVEQGARTVPVPWIFFSWNAEQDKLIYVDDAQRMFDAPGFGDRSDLVVSRSAWNREIRAYWGLEQ